MGTPRSGGQTEEAHVSTARPPLLSPAPPESARLLEALRVIGSDLELPVVLRHIVEAAVHLVRVGAGALGVVDADRQALGELITVGVDPAGAGADGARGVLEALLRAPAPLHLNGPSQDPRSLGCRRTTRRRAASSASRCWSGTPCSATST
jgi:hypothetical protein